MNVKRFRVYWQTCVLMFLAAASVEATTIVMPSDEQLVAKSPLIIEGTVVSSQAVLRGPEIWTETVVEVGRALKGSSASSITIREIGGIAGDRITKVYGAPEYRAGEHVLAFLTATARGDYQTVDLFVGKFTDERTLSGERLWSRHDARQDAILLDRNLRPITSKNAERDAAAFEEFIGDRVAGRPASLDYGVENPLVKPVAGEQGPRGRIVSDFTLIAEPAIYRWGAFDNGGSAPWFSYGTQPGYTGGGVTEVQTAMAAWDSYGAAKINYVYSGSTTASPGGLSGPNGVNEILFNDPKGEIAGSWDPSKGGVVGQGGFNGVSGSQNWTAPFTADSQHPAGTVKAFVIVEGNLTIQDNVSSATGIPSKTFAEIVAHEFGHTLGFGHSTDSTALMYATVTGLGPSLRTDDQIAARWLYPSGTGTTLPPMTTTVPPAPTGLTATPSGTSAALQWSGTATNETGQTLYASINSGPFTKAVDLAAGQRSATINGFTAGAWRLYLTSYNSAGESSPSNTVSFNITTTAAPVAAFTVSPASGVAGQTLFTFTDQSTGTITSRSWAFGDGSTSTLASPTHTYNVAGNYTAVLTVSGSGGQSQSSKLISVTAALPPLVAAFTNQPPAPTTAQDVTFTDQSTGGVTSWLWNFGDGTSSPSQNPVHRYATAGAYNVTLTVFRNSQSAAASKTINVASATGAVPAPVASFDFSPGTSTSGQVVTFSDRSTGATSWLWNFGDGSSSTQQNPSHAYASAGTYTVVLTASNSASSSVTSRSVTIAAAVVPFRSLVSVTAQTTGVGGSTWRTELTIFNAGDTNANVTLTFVSATGGSALTRNLVLASRQSVTYNNALVDLFGLSAGAGAVTVDATNPASSPNLKVSSRTFTNGAAGTYGQAVPDVPASALQANLYLTGMESDSAYRTNLGLVNGSASPVGTILTLSDPDGNNLGTARLALGANSFQQASLASFFPAVAAAGYSGLSLQVSSAVAGAVSVYASVIDNRTQDPVYIQAVPAIVTNSTVIPVVGRAPGANGTLWRSDVTMFNPGGTWISGTVRFLPANSDGRNAPGRSISLAPGRTVVMSDILSWLGISAGSGAFELAWTGGNAPVVTSRTYTTATAGGTYGQSIDPVNGYGRDSYVTGLRSDAAFRTNAGLVNGGDAPAAVTLQLLSSSGAVLATSSTTLAPRSQTQSSLGSLFPGLDVSSLGAVTLFARSDGGTLFAYGSIIDNVSGDPVFFAGR